MNSMTNIAEYGKKPLAQFTERVFFLFHKKNATFVLAKCK